MRWSVLHPTGATLTAQKQKKKENRKRGNEKSKMGDGIHGVLATRNPTS
jgi:hypothetical protein